MDGEKLNFKFTGRIIKLEPFQIFKIKMLQNSFSQDDIDLINEEKEKYKRKEEVRHIRKKFLSKFLSIFSLCKDK